MKLPGVGYDQKEKDMIATFKLLEEWRDQMKMPPRLSAFHHAASQLNLLGDDVEERVMLNERNKVRYMSVLLHAYIYTCIFS
jgi:hypothetical protein